MNKRRRIGRKTHSREVLDRYEVKDRTDWTTIQFENQRAEEKRLRDYAFADTWDWDDGD